MTFLDPAMMQWVIGQEAEFRKAGLHGCADMMRDVGRVLKSAVPDPINAAGQCAARETTKVHSQTPDSEPAPAAPSEGLTPSDAAYWEKRALELGMERNQLERDLADQARLNDALHDETEMLRARIDFYWRKDGSAIATASEKTRD